MITDSADNDKATFLLTVPVPAPPGLKVLTPSRWKKLIAWLSAHKMEPGALLRDGIPDSIGASGISAETIHLLLDRGRIASADEMLAIWFSYGIRTISIYDPDYPGKLKQHLAGDAPAVLFVAGDVSLLQEGGLAVVGARKTTDDNYELARHLGRLAANEHQTIVSGLAAGIDTCAMEGALGSGGSAVGVLPANIIEHAARYHEFLDNDTLTLVSPFSPLGRWRGWKAMARNRHIYCLADAAVALGSKNGTGGTWAGAKENLKKNWVPLWVKESDHPKSGSAALVSLGANWLPHNLENVATLLPGSGSNDQRLEQGGVRHRAGKGLRGSEDSSVRSDSEAILLCTAWFGRLDCNPQPLSAAEWETLARWLFVQGLTPTALLDDLRLTNFAAQEDLPAVFDRLPGLLSRTIEIAFARQRWTQAGIWLLTRADYSRGLRKLLRPIAPPVLYCCGNKDLLGEAALPRADEQDIWLAESSVMNLARHLRRPIISTFRDDAQRKDPEPGIGRIVVCESGILEHAVSQKYRRALMQGELLLIGTQDPDAGSRHEDRAGADELVRRLTMPFPELKSAPREYLEWAPAQRDTAPEHKESVELQPERMPSNDLYHAFLGALETLTATEPLNAKQINTRLGTCRGQVFKWLGRGVEEGDIKKRTKPATHYKLDRPRGSRIDASTIHDCMYNAFLNAMRALTEAGPLPAEEIREFLDITLAQWKAWRTTALKNGDITQLTRSNLYQFNSQIRIE